MSMSTLELCNTDIELSNQVVVLPRPGRHPLGHVGRCVVSAPALVHTPVTTHGVVVAGHNGDKARALVPYLLLGHDLHTKLSSIDVSHAMCIEA